MCEHCDSSAQLRMPVEGYPGNNETSSDLETSSVEGLVEEPLNVNPRGEGEVPPASSLSAVSLIINHASQGEMILPEPPHGHSMVIQIFQEEESKWNFWVRQKWLIRGAMLVMCICILVAIFVLLLAK